MKQIEYFKLIEEAYPVNTSLTQLDRNKISTLNRWLELNRKEKISLIGDELGKNFEESRISFFKKYDDFSKNTHMLFWYKLYQRINSSELYSDEITMAQFLKLRMRQLDIKTSMVEKDIGAIIFNWLDGTMPSNKTFESLDKLSEILELKNDFLRKTFLIDESPVWAFSKTNTSYQKKISRLKGDDNYEYSIGRKNWLSPEFDKLRKDYDEYVHYKTVDILPVGVYRAAKQKWTVRPSGRCGSSEIFLSFLNSYFGYLKNILKIQKVWSLSDVLNDELFSKFLEYYKTRHYGEETTTRLSYLKTFTLVASYFRQYPSKLHDTNLNFVIEAKQSSTVYKMQIQEIQTKLLLIETHYRDAVKSIKKPSLQRNPEEQLAPLLALSDILEPFICLLSRLKSNYSRMLKFKNTFIERYNCVRDICIMSCLLEKPLRLSNIEECKYDENLLFDKQANRWSFSFKGFLVKNNRDIIKTFSKETSCWLSLYYEIYYKVINKNNLKHSFLTDEGDAFSESRVSQIIARRTAMFFNGFIIRTHAFRHIRATDWLKKHPGEYLYVAYLLDDRLETVTTKYSHLKHQDISKQDDDYIEGLYDKAAESSKSNSD
jgi:integrase